METFILNILSTMFVFILGGLILGAITRPYYEDEGQG